MAMPEDGTPEMVLPEDIALSEDTILLDYQKILLYLKIPTLFCLSIPDTLGHGI